MFAGKDAETEIEARCCIVCRTPLPSTARADARLCSPTCRQRARRRDHVTLRVILPSGRRLVSAALAATDRFAAETT
jgi:predicted nucleic acid-binding Zn ribbon protein